MTGTGVEPRRTGKFLFFAAAILALLPHPGSSLLNAQPPPVDQRTVQSAADPFFSVSDAFSPPVSYSLQQNNHALLLKVRIGTFTLDGQGATLAVGLHAARTLLLAGADATVSYRPSEVDYTFSIRNEALGFSTDTQAKLRFAFAVSWSGEPFGRSRLEERFLQPNTALAGSLSPNPDDWSPIDLAAQASLIVARRRRIWIELRQPMDGKATIAIDDAQGNRIRNLISGEPMTAGLHSVEWNGLDDQGKVVAPGKYHWRAVSHPGITPKYLFSFYNHGNPPWRSATPSSDWLSDHANAVAAAASGGRIYLGAPMAESGHNVVKLDTSGNPAGHVDFPTLVGIGKLFLLADDTGFYAVMEGRPLYEPFQDVSDKGWEFRRPLNVLHWDLHEQPLPYDGPRGEKVVTENLYRGTGPHPHPSNIPPAENLAGAAILHHRIYISLSHEDRIVAIDSATGVQTGEIKLPNPGLLAADGDDSLIAFSGDSLVRIDAATSHLIQLFAPSLSPLPKLGDPEDAFYGFAGQDPTGIAVDADHNIYLSDNGTDQNIKVFSDTGRLLREIGAKGGRPLVGRWMNNAVYRPHGIAIDDKNQLWVTETDAYPRRISLWDAASGRYLRQYFGPATYGASEASFDVADHTQWIAGGVLWKLNFATKSAEPQSVLLRQTRPDQLENQLMGQYWNFYHRDGRTFLISYGDGQSVYELQKDGSAKLWAICGTLSSITQFPRWTLPRAIASLPAVQALIAANARQFHADSTLTPFGPWNDKLTLDERLLHNISILWVDRNGDGLVEPDEFEILPSGDTFFTPGWGTGSPTLNMNIPARINGAYALLHLDPQGFLPSGAPNYSLKTAVQSALPLSFNPAGNGDGGQSVQDRFGREIFNNTPMRAVAADGKTLWTFANRWVGVHGSQEAPLPRRGEMQGVLYFLGTAPLDSQSEVMVMNGNHGRFFVMTTDGMYLDEFFKDIRVSQRTDAYRIGDEPFGGFFARGEDGKYYLQSGHTDYRIFEIDGLQNLRRSEGSVTITKEQAESIESNLNHQQSHSQEAKVAVIPAVPAEAKVSADPEQWPVSWSSVQWGDPSQQFPFAQVKILRSDSTLHLAYRVEDPSPWRNNGSDWTLLFKTGDSIDFQFSTNPAADPDRTTPAPGDKRLLIAPFHRHPIAVLYSYREANAQSVMPFSSPWRTENVDRVVQLQNARIFAESHADSYEVIASIPLSDLGLPGAATSVTLRGDFGVIYGDANGTIDQLRSYWSNKATGLVSDVPGEVTVMPNLWGTLDFEAAKP
jgi:hypothetical protein